MTYLADTIRGMREHHFELCQFRDTYRDGDNLTEGGAPSGLAFTKKMNDGDIWSKNDAQPALRVVVDRFIARANIAHFEDLLAAETDPQKRRVIENLLARERQKLEIAEHQSEAAGKPSDPKN
ncbi:MAG: hypothetical protein E5X76_09910 [Mesorhizobium sp.]|nr:MAG: hypothetical protein E5X76_09910 [Mesorhizobium sp.]